MDGVKTSAPRALQAAAAETVTVSYLESARHLVPGLLCAFEAQGLTCCVDEKLHNPGEVLAASTARRIQESDVLCIVISRRCRDAAWQGVEAAVAADRHIPLLIFVEDLQLEWLHATVPTLLTAEIARLAAFAANSRVDSAGLWEFGRIFFTDRSNAASFQRAPDGAWRWERESGVLPESETFSLSLEMRVLDDSRPVLPDVKLLHVMAETGSPVVLLGTNDGKRYRLAYSREIRAVIPAPAFPGTPAIGFMHADFDSGREWSRAGEAPVELRLLGREVYGWHMREYFWRAFVGSLPKMLGGAAGR